MYKKCWTESGDRGSNYRSIEPEPTNKKLLGKHNKKTDQNQYLDCSNEKLINWPLSINPNTNGI